MNHERAQGLAPWRRAPDQLISMPVLTTSGTPYDRGYGQGVAFRDLVHLGIRTWLEGRTLRDDEKARVANSREHVRAHFPRLWEEMEGVARGAEVPVETIFDLSAFNAVPSCTAMAVAGTDGEVVVGSTQDIDATQRQFSAVHRTETDGGQRMAMLIWAGALWTHAGVNSSGLALCVTSAPRISGQDGHGLPQHLVAYEVLSDCSDVPEAIGRLSGIVCAGKGIAMVVADREGRTAAVEKSYDRQAAVQGIGMSVFRTNHFLAREMTRYNPTGTPTADNSRARFARLDRELAGERFADPVATARDLLSTHGEGGICQHRCAGLDTLAAALISPRQGWIDICGGKPCSDAFRRFGV